MNPKTWHQITKGGLPNFIVVRPMLWSDKSLEPGEKFPGSDDKHRTKMLYDQNFITVAPVSKEAQKQESPPITEPQFDIDKKKKSR